MKEAEYHEMREKLMEAFQNFSKTAAEKSPIYSNCVPQSGIAMAKISDAIVNLDKMANDGHVEGIAKGKRNKAPTSIG